MLALFSLLTSRQRINNIFFKSIKVQHTNIITILTSISFFSIYDAIYYKFTVIVFFDKCFLQTINQKTLPTAREKNYFFHLLVFSLYLFC